MKITIEVNNTRETVPLDEFDMFGLAFEHGLAQCAGDCVTHTCHNGWHVLRFTPFSQGVREGVTLSWRAPSGVFPADVELFVREHYR